MTEIPLIDFHCHLDLFGDPAEAFLQCKANKTLTVSVTTTPRAWKQNVLWAKDNAFVVPALGLHPELVATHESESTMLLELMEGVRLIGEIGLDGSARHKKSLPRQRQIFEAVIAKASTRRGCILSIHSRAATQDVLNTLRSVPSRDGITPILHWFSGTSLQLRDAIDVGCWFSVNGSMLQTERGQSLVQNIPRDRLLTESDAPFRGASSVTARDEDLRKTLSGLAKIYGLKTLDLALKIKQNAENVLIGETGSRARPNT